MKRRFSFQWVAFALLVALHLSIALPGCTPYMPSTQTSRSALVRVECYNASVQQILQLLRSGRGKDINVTTDGGMMEVTAAFSPEFTDAGRLAQILHDLNGLSGVVHVEIEENPRPIRENF